MKSVLEEDWNWVLMVRRKMHAEFWLGNVKTGDHLQDLGVDGG
jgi:hypothetical protein